MKQHLWKTIELICYILKIAIRHYDTRTKKPQPTEHPQE